MSYKVTGSSEKGKFINAIKGLSHPEKVSRALKTICDITAKTQVITQLNECETVAPLVEIALNYKDGPEREDAFAALLNIFKSSGKPPASATWDNPAKSFADRLVDMSLSYMGSSDDNSETQGIGLVVLGNAARLCSNPKIIKDSPFVEVEGKNIKLIPNALFLMGSLIERYYTDCDALKKSEKELEKSKLRDLYTKPSSLSSSSSSSSPPPSPQSLPRTQHQTASTVVKTTACASTSSSGTSQQQAQEYPKIEDYFDEEKVKSIANRHKYSLDLHEKHTPQQDPHNKYVIYFYERVTIHAIKQNVSGLEEVIKKTLEASFSAITEKDSFGFTLKFLIEYITFSNTEDTDMLNKCIRTIEKGFKSIRNYKELDKFLNIYSEHFYHKNLKRLDKSVVLITRTMMSNCSEESLQAFALKALASVPISIINAPIVGTRETVSYVTSTLKNYRQNKDILLNGLKLLCNLIDFGNKEVNEEVAKEVNNSLYMRETFRALLSALTSKDMMLKVIGYKAFIQALDVKDKKVRLVDSCLRSDDVINKLLADVKADGQINKSRNLQEGALEMLLKLNLDKRVDAKFFEDDTIYAKGTTCCLLFRIAERLETLSKGAFDKVLSALEKHIADWEVQRLGCLIIGNNVTKDNIDRGLEVVIRAVETYNVQNVLSAGYKAILTIWNKLESEHERIYEQIGGELFFKTSSETDWRHPNIDKINSMTAANYFELVFALLDVFSLSKLDSNSTEILMIEVRAMERHRTDERVQLACCKIIKHFLGSNAFYAIKDTLEQVLEELTGINRGNRTLVDLYGDLRKGDDSRPGKKDPGKRINSRKSIVIAKSMNQINIDAELPESTGILSLFAMGPMEMQKTLEESLREAEFKEIQSLLKYSREVAEYLRDEGVLDKYKMTLSESMAITIYTYDNGPDMLEYNPYRIINKALATADKDAIRKLRLYIFYLLKALRKLKKTEAQKLYRTIRGSRDQTYNVGKELIWPAFTSTTTDKAVAEDFINNFNEETDIVLFEINGQGLNGYNIREFSFHPDEDGK